MGFRFHGQVPRAMPWGGSLVIKKRSLRLVFVNSFECILNRCAGLCTAFASITRRLRTWRKWRRDTRNNNFLIHALWSIQLVGNENLFYSTMYEQPTLLPIFAIVPWTSYTFNCINLCMWHVLYVAWNYSFFFFSFSIL